MHTVAHAFRCAGATTVRMLKSQQREGARDGEFGFNNQPEHDQYCDRSSSTLWNQGWGPPPFAPCFEGLKPSAQRVGAALNGAANT